jgi:hypothetical protein
LIKRNAIAKVTAIGVLAVLILAGAVGIYFYTMPSTTTTGSTTSIGSSSTATSNSETSSGSETTSSQSAATTAPSGGGYQTNGIPEGAWADYLGYIPSGYSLAPHLPNAATYPCPSGMDSSQCATFHQSCGNGVCDPNESCATCPIDCGVSGQLTCDPYTGRPGAPISICQLGGAG